MTLHYTTLHYVTMSKELTRRPRLIGEEPDYIAPYDPGAVRVHRSRAACALPKPRRDLTLQSHVVTERNRLRRLWLTGMGWDYRALSYSLPEIIRRAWPIRQHTPLAGDPYIHALLRRSRVPEPYVVYKGLWSFRRLTAKEMRRVVVTAASMRAERALLRASG